MHVNNRSILMVLHFNLIMGSSMIKYFLNAKVFNFVENATKDLQQWCVFSVSKSITKFVYPIFVNAWNLIPNLSE